jgi:hypothetical protein
MGPIPGAGIESRCAAAVGDDEIKAGFFGRFDALPNPKITVGSQQYLLEAGR